jgi:hypothetical protein
MNSHTAGLVPDPNPSSFASQSATDARDEAGDYWGPRLPVVLPIINIHRDLKTKTNIAVLRGRPLHSVNLQLVSGQSITGC